jgi:hypothetical protein
MARRSAHQRAAVVDPWRPSGHKLNAQLDRQQLLMATSRGRVYRAQVRPDHRDARGHLPRILLGSPDDRLLVDEERTSGWHRTKPPFALELNSFAGPLNALNRTAQRRGACWVWTVARTAAGTLASNEPRASHTLVVKAS